MIQSMTGFGKAETIINDNTISIEIRTLNSKNLDVNFRMPTNFKSFELGWKKIIASYLQRGKVDVMINLNKSEGNGSVKLNKPLIKQYVDQMQDILPLRGGMDNAKLLEIAMKMPDAIISKEDEATQEDEKELRNALEIAIEQVLEFRNQEGKSLYDEFVNNLKSIDKNLEKVDSIDKGRIEKVRERLLSSLTEIEVNYDENRFEQELIYYIEKYDISEEKTRLKNHIEYFDKTLDTKQSNGKKLNFISQEMGREINTIGSKANDAEMQNLVVEMKDKLEKIKEQILNVV